jgi:hypothetical protein
MGFSDANIELLSTDNSYIGRKSPSLIYFPSFHGPASSPRSTPLANLIGVPYATPASATLYPSINEFPSDGATPGKPGLGSKRSPWRSWKPRLLGAVS